MKNIITLFSALLISAVSFAQTRSVMGLVNDENGEPISGVTIVAEGGAATATSGSDGRFEMNVPYSSRTVTASHEMYLTKSVEIEGSFVVISMKLNLEAARANSTVSQKVFKGVVKDEDGEPISGALVSVGENIETKTDVNGRFEIKAPSSTKLITASGKYLVTKTIEIDDPNFIIISLSKDVVAIRNQEQAAKLEKKKKEYEEQAKLQAQADSLQAIEDARMRAYADSVNAARAAEAERAQFVADSIKAEKLAEQARLKAEADSIKAAQLAEMARIKAEADSIKKAHNDSIAAVKQARKDSLTAIRLADIARNDSLYRNHGFIKSVEVSYNSQLNTSGEVIYQNYGYRSYGDTTPLELTATLGYRFNNAMALSLGSGITYQMVNLAAYGDTFSTAAYGKVTNYKNYDVPVFLNMKFFLTRTKVQPMISVSGGLYLLSSTKLANAGLGVNIRVSEESNLYVLGTVGITPWPQFKDSASLMYTSPLTAGVKLGLAF